MDKELKVFISFSVKSPLIYRKFREWVFVGSVVTQRWRPKHGRDAP
jgi:hypothetical protein